MFHLLKYLDFFSDSILILISMLIGILIISLIKLFIDNKNINSFRDSLYFTIITFSTVGFGDIKPENGLGRILSAITGLAGVLSMGLFVSASFQSFSNVYAYKQNLKNDKRLLKVLTEIRQDYVNVFGNFNYARLERIGQNNLEQYLLNNVGNIATSFYRKKIPNLKGSYFKNGKDAFFNNIELINNKIQNFVLLNISSNYSSDFKLIAYKSRNLVNHFLWGFIKNSHLDQNQMKFFKKIVILGRKESNSFVKETILIESKLQKLVAKISENLKNEGLYETRDQ